jgi:predicted GH43/DUF377 family glycosyl hydrolase
MREPVVKRFKNNPILTKDQIPYKVETVHNAGVVKFDETYVMLFRSHLQNGRSIIGIAHSDDGFSFKAGKEPFLLPCTEGPFAEYEEFGVEDPRICAMDDVGYLITYSAYSRHGVRIALAKTHDFKSIERVALISQPDMRNAVIFPEKIDGRYVRLDRPHSEISPWSICISYSPDLIHWGDSKVVIKPVPYHWDQMKIGPGATPFRTDKGWLSIYHGVFETMAGAVYRLGVALHDYDNPATVLGVSDDWILEPEDPWERTGYVPNVVFSCGAVPETNGTVKIYWGAADTVMCAGTANITELEKMCLENSRPPY